MTTSDYLNQLQQDREDLVDNLETKGITGLTGDETFTELVPEVLNIAGGADLSEYFKDTINGVDTNLQRTGNWVSSIKKLPDNFPEPNTYKSVFGHFKGTSLDNAITNWQGAIDISYIFYQCDALTQLDLSKWDKEVQYASQAFYGCVSLQKLDIRKMTFNFSSTGFYTQMFFNVPNNCLILVKSQTEKSWFNTNFSNLTNVQIAEEYEASLSE